MTKKKEAPRAITKVDDRERSIEVAMAEYRKEQEAISKRTAQLRELRLAHERKHGKPKRKGDARVAQPTILADWYEEQKNGRDT